MIFGGAGFDSGCGVISEQLTLQLSILIQQQLLPEWIAFSFLTLSDSKNIGLPDSTRPQT